MKIDKLSIKIRLLQQNVCISVCLMLLYMRAQVLYVDESLHLPHIPVNWSKASSPILLAEPPPALWDLARMTWSWAE